MKAMPEPEPEPAEMQSGRVRGQEVGEFGDDDAGSKDGVVCYLRLYV